MAVCAVVTGVSATKIANDNLLLIHNWTGTEVEVTLMIGCDVLHDAAGTSVSFHNVDELIVRVDNGSTILVRHNVT